MLDSRWTLETGAGTKCLNKLALPTGFEPVFQP